MEIVTVAGLPVTVDACVVFSFAETPLADVAGFCATAFAADAPHNLWGIAREDQGGLAVSCVDLEGGGTFRAQVFSDSLAVYAPRERVARVAGRMLAVLLTAVAGRIEVDAC